MGIDHDWDGVALSPVDLAIDQNILHFPAAAQPDRPQSIPGLPTPDDQSTTGSRRVDSGDVRCGLGIGAIVGPIDWAKWAGGFEDPPRPLHLHLAWDRKRAPEGLGRS